tara:strand:+ start:124568 stop:125182 length:615 start_codon:yes stop_codon:yes gene_type:complete
VPNKTKKKWLKEFVADPYVRAAKKIGYRSRAAFKLIEIDEHLGFIRNARNILDIGSAPGSWTQVILERAKKKPKLLAIDLITMEPLDGAHFIEGDIRAEDTMKKISSYFKNEKIDLILSDMSPNISGIREVDSIRVMELGELVLEFSMDNLSDKGNLALKTFQGKGFTQLIEKFKKVYKNLAVKKPMSSRSDSSEIYVVARDFK